MKYQVMLPPPEWSIEFDTFEEAVAWIRTHRGAITGGLFGPNYDGPEDKSRGLTPEEIEELEEIS